MVLPVQVRSFGEVIDLESVLGGADVSRETMELLAAFVDRLLKWQTRINLIAPSTEESVWPRHVADSAQLVPYLPEDARKIVDLGSGGGFPGVVLAIFLRNRPGVTVHLVDSNHKKCAFLQDIAARLALPVRVHAVRAGSDDSRETIGIADVVTARGFAPLDRLFPMAAAYWGPETVGLFLKGQNVEEELTAAAECWKLRYQFFPSRSDPGGVVLKVEGLHRDTND